MLGFGGGKEKVPSRVGAREKMRQARNAMGGGQPQGDKNAKQTPPAVAVISIYAMSVALAYVLTENYISQGGLHLSLGDADLDRLLFKPGSHSFTGTSETDYLILIMIRGFAIFFVAGIWPFTSLVVQRALDNATMNVYRVFWGTPIGLTLLFILFKDYLGPMLSEVIKLMT